jgi:NAD(P)-dependent dehydrogenase (short-subunit alcohol dehydrogenase family)
MSKTWTTKDIPPQSGKRIIVTGANSGIGWNTALELARAGAEVTVASRRKDSVLETSARIRAVVPDARVKTAVLDLSDPASVDRWSATL